MSITIPDGNKSRQHENANIAIVEVGIAVNRKIP